jgi:hypothetical protein
MSWIQESLVSLSPIRSQYVGPGPLASLDAAISGLRVGCPLHFALRCQYVFGRQCNHSVAAARRLRAVLARTPAAFSRNDRRPFCRSSAGLAQCGISCVDARRRSLAHRSCRCCCVVVCVFCLILVPQVAEAVGPGFSTAFLHRTSTEFRTAFLISNLHV